MQKTLPVKRVLSKLSQWCAYTHLYKLLKTLVNGEKLSEQAKAGRNIALLGLFCPFFWYALLSGAQTSTVIMHATHSGVVFLIGVAIMAVSFLHKK